MLGKPNTYVAFPHNPTHHERQARETLLQRAARKLIPRWEILTVAGREVKGIVVTPVMGLTLILAIATAIGGVYWRLSDKLDASRDLLIQKIAKDEVERDWAKSELRRVDNQNKINYELYRQQGENYKQVLGYMQGRSGARLMLPEVAPPPSTPPQQ